jgi:hypothetical protein
LWRGTACDGLGRQPVAWQREVERLRRPRAGIRRLGILAEHGGDLQEQREEQDRGTHGTMMDGLRIGGMSACFEVFRKCISA